MHCAFEACVPITAQKITKPISLKKFNLEKRVTISIVKYKTTTKNLLQRLPDSSPNYKI